MASGSLQLLLFAHVRVFGHIAIVIPDTVVSFAMFEDFFGLVGCFGQRQLGLRFGLHRAVVLC